MIVMQRVGSDFRGVLAYAMQPKKEPRIIGGSIGGQDQPLADIVRQFKATQLLRPSLKQCVHHAAIAFKSEENLPDHQLKVLAKEYLQRMGWDLEKTRWVLIRHNDTQHHHAHLIASRIQMNTKVVSDSLSWLRGMRICRQLEEEYGLEPVSSEPRRERRMSATEQQMHSRLEERSKQMQLSEEHSSEIVQPPQSFSKPVMKTIEEVQKAVREATTMRQSLSEFMSALAQRGIDVRARLDVQGEVAGLSYRLDGRNFKASSLGANFTWQHLQQKGQEHEQQRDEQWQEQWRRAAQFTARRDNATHTEFRADPAIAIHSTEARTASTEFSPTLAFTADHVAEWQVGASRRELEVPIALSSRELEDTIAISPRTVELASVEFTGAPADLLSSDGVQTTSDGFLLLPGNRQSDQEAEFDDSNPRNQESLRLDQRRPRRILEGLRELANSSRELGENNPEYRSDFQQYNARSGHSDTENTRIIGIDEQGDYNPRLPTQTNAEVFATSGDWLEHGNGLNSGNDVLLSTHQEQRSSGAFALENLWSRNDDPREIGATHESRETQVSPEISSGDEQQVEDSPIGLSWQGVIDEGRPSETVGELNAPLHLPLGNEPFQKKVDIKESAQKPPSQEQTEREAAELEQQEEEEEIDDWVPSNVGSKDLLKTLQATGIVQWNVRVLNPTNPDFPVQNNVMDDRAIGSRQAQFRGLHDNIGMQIELSPESENHGLIFIDHLRLHQVAKMQEELPLAAILRTGGDRCQVWLRHSKQMSEEERLVLQAEYIERFGGRAGQLRLVGVDQKVELLIADPDAVIEVEDMDRLLGRGSVIEVPIPPRTKPTAELATITEWIATEELSQVFSPESSELEMAWDAKRDQLRFHNGPWVSDELDTLDLIDFCLWAKQAKADWEQQQIWEQEQQQKSGRDFER